MARSRRSSSRSRSGGSGSSNSNPALSENRRGRRSPAKKEKSASGGLLGWFQDAGDFIADKWDSTTEAVGDWAQGVGDSARELHQAWKATDLGMADGKITLDTDLDEIVDILPENALGGLQLAEGGESGNKLHVELDRKTGQLTITSGDIRVAGINNGNLSTGPISLQGVTINVTNHDGGIPMIDGDFSLFGFKDKDDNVAVDVEVASVLASAVKFNGAEGPMSVDSLLLNGFRLDASSKGGVPFGEKGTTTASFDVAGAVLRGVSANGTTATQVEASELSGGISESAETAFVSAGSVHGAGVKRDGMDLGSATLNDVRADVRNEGGGLLLLDDQEDKMKANVSVASATVNDGKSGANSVDQASLNDLQLYHDAVGGRTEVDAGSMAVSGLDTEKVDAASASVSDFSLDLDQVNGSTSAQASASSVSARGLDAVGTQAESVQLGGLAAQLDGKDVDAQLGSARVTGVTSNGAKVNEINAANLSAQSAGDNAWLKGDSVDVSGASFDGNSVDKAAVNGINISKTGKEVGGTVDGLSLRGAKSNSLDASVDAVDISNINGKANGSDFSGGAGQVAVRGARQGEDVSVDSVNVSNLQGSVKNGTAQGSADRVVVDKARVNELTVGRAEAGNVSASKDANEANFAAGDIGINDLSAHNLKAGRIDAKDAKGRVAGSDMSGGLGSASVDDLLLGERMKVSRADVSGVSSGVEGGVRRSRIDKASISGVSDSVTGSTVQSGELSGVDLQNTGKQYDAKIAQAKVAGVDAMGNSVESVSASGLDVSTGEQGHGGAVQQLDVKNAKSAMGGVKHASITDASGGMSAGGDLDARVKQAQATGLSVNTPTASANISSASISNADVSKRSGGDLSAGADSVKLGQTSFDAAAKSEPNKAPALNVDQASLIRTGLARVDNADISGSMGLKEGKYDAGIGIGVERNERLDVNVKVRDNQLVGGEGGTKARFREGLDGPLWTELQGAEVDEKGKIIANVGGFFDQNVTKKVNKAAGLEGKRAHSLAAYGAGAANAMENSASSGAATSAKSGKPGIGEAFDSNDHDFRARVGLSGGEIDAGDAKVDLASKQGANEVSVSSKGGEELVVSFAQFLANSLSVNVGGQSIDAGSTSIDDANVAVDQGEQKGNVTGSVGGVSIEDVRLNR